MLKQEPGAANFVSANDILTCAFAKTIDADMLTMAMDFRGKLSGLTTQHAGCYMMSTLLGPEGYKSANTIRKALSSPPPYSRCEKFPTGCCDSGNFTGLITNWSSFAKKGLVIPNSAQTLHIPYENMMLAITDLCLVFNTKPGQVAIIVVLPFRRKE